MEIPKQVTEAAKGLADYGGTLIKIGNYQGQEVYSWHFDEPVTIGLPEVYLWDGQRAKIVYGDKAVKIISDL